MYSKSPIHRFKSLCFSIRPSFLSLSVVDSDAIGSTGANWGEVYRDQRNRGKVIAHPEEVKSVDA